MEYNYTLIKARWSNQKDAVRFYVKHLRSYKLTREDVCKYLTKVLKLAQGTIKTNQTSWLPTSIKEHAFYDAKSNNIEYFEHELSVPNT